MLLYADSSALVKRYLRERGSEKLNAKINAVAGHARNILVSVLTFAELHTAFARKLQDNPPLRATDYHLATTRFDSDWTYMTKVELLRDVLDLIPNLAKKHFLKASDNVHLASALWFRQRLGYGQTPLRGAFVFATSDKQLARAAEYEQLEVFDPEV